MASTTDQMIRESLRGIGQAECDIDAARAAASQARAEINLYEQRRGEVQAVLSSFVGSLNDNASLVASFQRAASGEIDGATSGFGHKQTLLSQIQDDHERETESDALGSEARAALERELARCDRCISEANANLADASRREQAAQSVRASHLSKARMLADSSDATVSVSVRSRY